MHERRRNRERRSLHRVVLARELAADLTEHDERCALQRGRDLPPLALHLARVAANARQQLQELQRKQAKHAERRGELRPPEAEHEISDEVLQQRKE